MASKRILKELDIYYKSPSTSVSHLAPASDSDLFNLSATLAGPAGTPYETGLFKLTIALPSTYPNAPPVLLFSPQTPCCHPNVNFKTGEICLDLLKQSWTPAYGIVSTLEAVGMLLQSGGDAESPLNLEVAKLVREGDEVGRDSLVRFMTRTYAVGR